MLSARRFIASWFSENRRSLRVGKLFLFEFAVVLLGVLAAQWLSSQYNLSRDRADAADAVAAFEKDLKRFSSAGEYYSLTGDCMRKRMVDLIEFAKAGTAPADYQLGPPFLPDPRVARWDANVERAVSRYQGEDIAKRYNEYILYGDRIRRLNEAIYDDWALVRMLSPGFSDASAIEKAELRIALLRNYTRLGQLVGNTKIFRNELAAIGLEPDEETLSGYIQQRAPCTSAVASAKAKDPES